MQSKMRKTPAKGIERLFGGTPHETTKVNEHVYKTGTSTALERTAFKLSYRCAEDGSYANICCTAYLFLKPYVQR